MLEIDPRWYLKNRKQSHRGHIKVLTHWGRVTHICVDNLAIIGSDNGLSPGRRQAIIWTNDGILLIGPPGTNFSEIVIEIHTFSSKKMRFKLSSGKWRPFCLGLNVLKTFCFVVFFIFVCYKRWCLYLFKSFSCVSLLDVTFLKIKLIKNIHPWKLYQQKNDLALVGFVSISYSILIFERDFDAFVHDKGAVRLDEIWCILSKKFEENSTE